MNLLGKLLIVLIFVGSIMFASFAVVLYATKTNWREAHSTANQALQARTQELAELQRQRDALEAALSHEINNRGSRIIALQETVDLLTRDNETAELEVTRLRLEEAGKRAEVEAALEALEHARIRLAGESEALHLAHTEWVEMSTNLVREKDRAHSLAIQVANLQSTAARLADDYRKAIEVLRLFGLQPDPALYPRTPPAEIRGVVTETRPGGWIEISVGTDSGLARGHQLDVVRNRDGRSVLVGKIEITDPIADRATARVMPEFNLGVVQRGDEVMYIAVSGMVPMH